MIIDSHQHVMLPTNMQLQKMDEADVDKAILFQTTPHVEKAANLFEVKQEMLILYNILSGVSSADRLDAMIKSCSELCNVIKEYPNRFLGFGSIPLGLSTKDAANWIEKYIISNNLRGVGEFSPGSEAQMQQLKYIFEALTDFPGYPIWVHTFNPVSLGSLKILMDLCRQYPSIPVIFGHLGGYNWMEVIEFAQNIPNAYLDLSASFTSLATKIAIAELPDRCLFSSDAPFGEPLLYRQLIEFVSPSKEVAQMVLGDNIATLLNLNN